MRRLKAERLGKANSRILQSLLDGKMRAPMVVVPPHEDEEISLGLDDFSFEGFSKSDGDDDLNSSVDDR